MRRTLRIFRAFFLSSLARELEFRGNFLLKVLHSMIWFLFSLLTILVIYGNTDQVAGWSFKQSLALIATVFLVDGLYGMFFIATNEIPQHVRQGTLDYVVTKPVDTQFWVTMRRFDFGPIGTILTSLSILLYTTLGQFPSVVNWLAYFALVGCALLIYASFLLMMMTTAIWFVRVDNLWVLGESVASIARYPMDIYRPGIQRFFTVVAPLAFISTIPVRQLMHGAQFSMVLLGLVWAFAFAILSRLFWRYAMRHYTSASS